MNPKYTTKELREKVLHYVSVYGGVDEGKSLTNGETTDVILAIFAARQQSLLYEIEKRVIGYDEEYPEDGLAVDVNSRNDLRDKQRATLKTIRKELR